MKNLKVSVAGATLILVSGITGFISGVNDVEKLKQKTITSEVEITDDSQITVQVLQNVVPSSTVTSVEIEKEGLVGENEQQKDGFSCTIEKDSDPQFEYFKEEKESFKEGIMNGDLETVVEIGKNYVQIGKDFIYNGTKIHGVTFDQLTEQGKKETLDNLAIIDGWIMAIDPDYKSQIEKGVDHTKNIFEHAKEKAKTWISSFGDAE